MNRFFRALFTVGGFLLASIGTAMAMPPFAQSYGMRCEVCHTQVPALNAYGRYLQRTGYASLDPHVLHRSTPFWIGESANYDSQDPNEPHRTEFGNLAIHAAGAFDKNVTFHFQQWIVQAGQPGGIDTAWITFNNLLNRDGHLFVGKMPGTTASPLSQWFDLASFATPEITVGEHAYQLDGNRWGAKFNYVKNSLDAEIGYFGDSSDLSGASAWGQNIEKTVQWRVAHANPTQPLEYGLMGSRGSFPLPEGSFDQYSSITPYLQRDPVGHMPGIFAMYQMAYDANAGQDAIGAPLGSAHSTAATIELYKPLGDKALAAFRKEFQNDGLGTQSQSGNIDLTYHVAPYLHLFLESAMAQNSQPAWRYMLWWTLPLQKVAGAAPAVASTPAVTQTSAPNPTAALSAPVVAEAQVPHPALADLAHGKQIYAQNCSSCHGASGQGGTGPPLRSEHIRKDEAAVILWIKKPAPPMPALYPSVLTEKDVRDVAAFVETLK
ncbi:MAG: hypothetical protein DLM50_07120 [Candidatus Meridianibacter frigidus]|nr:MAG: hypothetical protein DLM50_07120 [Candidatus Eremiobacteraeota bacterium]